MGWKIASLVALGGALGSLGRFWLAELAAPLSASFPWGTIAINVIGSFAIGAFGTLTLAGGRFPVAEEARLFFMVGVCGGFTTFSAFSLQTLDLLRAGEPTRALANALVSVIACVAAVAVGHGVAARINGGAVAIAQTADERLGGDTR